MGFCLILPIMIAPNTQVSQPKQGFPSGQLYLPTLHSGTEEIPTGWWCGYRALTVRLIKAKNPSII